MSRSRSILVGICTVIGLSISVRGTAQEPTKPPYERLLTGEAAVKAKDLLFRSRAAEAADNYDEAIKLSQELLALRAKLQGADHWETLGEQWELDIRYRVAALSPEKRAVWRKAIDRQKVVEKLKGVGQAAEAEQFCREYLQLGREVLGEKHLETATRYNNLGVNLDAQRKYTDAHTYHQKALDVYLELLGEKHPHTAMSCINLAANLYHQGRFADAQPFFQKALDVTRQLRGDNHPLTAYFYDGVASNLSELAKHADAELFYQKALDVTRELHGESHPDTALRYSNLGVNLLRMGKYADGHLLLQRALDIRRELLGENDARTALSYQNVGSALKHLGKSADAQPLLQKALDFNRNLHGEKNLVTVASYGELASNLFAQGKYADAQPLHERALDLQRELSGEMSEHTAIRYNNLGHNLSAQEKYADAQLLFEKALRIFRELRGEKHAYTATAYNNLATTLNDQGRYEEAEVFHRSAVDINIELGEKHPRASIHYINMAKNLRDQGKYVAAQALYEKALYLHRELLGKNHPTTAGICLDVAYYLSGKERYSDALPLLFEAAAGYEVSRLAVTSQALDRAAFGVTSSPYPLLAATHARLFSPTDAWVAAEADLARGLSDARAVRRGVTLAPDEETRRADLAARLNQLEPPIMQLVSKQSPADADQTELSNMQTDRRTLEEQLAALAVARSQREIASLANVQAALLVNAALVLWIDVGNESDRTQEHWGCVVRQSGEPKWERLPGSGPDKEWTKGDTTLPAKLQDALASGIASAADVDALAQRLSAQRLAPLAKHLDGVTTLYVVAVNEMASVPLEVLTRDYTISYVPSGSFLARLKDMGLSGSSSLLALGDPLFDRGGETPSDLKSLPPGGLLVTTVAPNGAAAAVRLQSGDVLLSYAGAKLTSVEELTEAIEAHKKSKEISITVWREGQEKPFIVPSGWLGVVLDKEPAPQAIANRRNTDEMLFALRRGSDWKELPGTRIELTQLAKLFAHETTTLLDSAASEQSLDEIRKSGELSKYRYLHFATHGEANNVRAMESALILAQDKLPETPLPRAGEPFINGRLSANEVLEFWNLDAELVTLSACETALGRPGGGDGLLGFAQAFLTAGSRAVCLSLWRVDDTATALLMSRFYQNLLGKHDGLDGPMPKAAALAEAKRWLRELSAEEALKLTAAATNGVVRGDRGKNQIAIIVPGSDSKESLASESKPFAHPRYWSAFILIGDPN